MPNLQRQTYNVVVVAQYNIPVAVSCRGVVSSPLGSYNNRSGIMFVGALL
jgi:hypothetical protein